jgi:hypothetical protein
MVSNKHNHPVSEPDTGWKTWLGKKMETQRGTRADEKSEEGGNRIGTGNQ